MAASATGAGGPPAAPQKGIGTKAKECFEETPIEKILRIERAINIVNGALLVISCIVAFSNVHTLNRAYLAVYIGIFAFMLLVFELRPPFADKRMRKLFGFLYSDLGRATFLLFVGMINFGVEDETESVEPECLAIGIVTIMNCCFNCAVVCAHPGFKKRDQTGGHKATANPADLEDDAVIAYLAAHPEVAAGALSVAVEAPQPTSAGLGGGGGGASRAAAPKPAPAAPPAAPARGAAAAPSAPARGAAASDNPFEDDNPFT